MDKNTINSRMLAELLCGGIQNLVIHRDEVMI